MDRADRLVITRVHLQPDGDTTFPVINSNVWREVERSEHGAGPEDEAPFAVLVYQRRVADAQLASGEN